MAIRMSDRKRHFGEAEELESGSRGYHPGSAPPEPTHRSKKIQKVKKGNNEVEGFGKSLSVRNHGIYPMLVPYLT
jgi:hypothetical protein